MENSKKNCPETALKGKVEEYVQNAKNLKAGGNRRPRKKKNQKKTLEVGPVLVKGANPKNGTRTL